MLYTPHPFQAAAFADAAEFLAAGEFGAKRMYSAPTGCGKSVIELLLRERFPELWIVTPRDEIIAGMLDKAELEGDPLQHRIATPVKLRNRLVDGRLRHPEQLCFDEGHHGEAKTWKEVDLLAGLCPSVAYTATAYRGTPRSTRALREVWGDPITLITHEEAEAEGYIRMPTFEILPLVDDDVVEVRGGEFEVESLEAATVDRLGDLAEQSRQWHDGKRWDLPTIYALPSSALCVRLKRELLARGLPAAIVSAATPKAEREPIFRAAVAGALALLHINIVSEGVDLKLRRLVDAAPTLSPVKWVQQLGRITRPWDRRPAYVCTNRNVLRHAHALHGCVPPEAVAEAQRAFPGVTKHHGRVLGLEAIGRFKPTALRLRSGTVVHAYALSTIMNRTVIEYTCIVHPAMEPIWASRIDTVNEAGRREWGTWTECGSPEDLRGFGSRGAKEPTERQLAWWRRSAAYHGLDPDQELDRRAFQALPVLSDLGLRLQ